MMQFLFDKYEFGGLRVKKCEVYPWTNKKEKMKFFMELIKNNTNYNKEKLFKFLEKETIEQIHINLSKSFIFNAISIFCIILAGIVLFTSLTTSIILAIFSFVTLFFKYIYRTKANLNLSTMRLTFSLVKEILK